MQQTMRKPPWLRRKISAPGHCAGVNRVLNDLHLHTVCEEAHCPNMGECYGHGTATFLLLGPHCTRNCRFCAVSHGSSPPDPDEPTHTAEAVSKLALDFCVLTMVTRDDLNDGGADHISTTIEEIRNARPGVGVEVLISDLGGDRPSLEKVIAASPEVLNHNVETVPRLYSEVRPQADYERSIELLAETAASDGGPVTKSGIMLGLGETRDELLKVFEDLRKADCEILTLGQYLAPSAKHYPIQRYVPPDEFDELAAIAEDFGFSACASGPYVRSSYNAADLYKKASGRR